MPEAIKPANGCDAGGCSALVIAHRGLAPGLPENTVAAFRDSIARGIPVIEVDLRGTKDGAVVILHDPTVDRTTNGKGKVEDMTLAQIQKLDAGSYAGARFRGDRIPTYQEALETIHGSGTKLLLDIKLDRTLSKERVVQLTEQYGATLDVIVGVRSIADLHAFHELDPNLRTLAFVPSVNSIGDFVSAGADMIRLWPKWIFVDEDSPQCREAVQRRAALVKRGLRKAPVAESCLVQKVHDLGRPVWTTADTMYKDINPSDPQTDFDRLIGARVDGIITNLPQLLQSRLPSAHRSMQGGDSSLK